ncbi:acyltransferase family protein [Pedobacter xixiisoli]|uniref:Predicted acyltransferase n=1 Tax=Pedobacter xixiisoli TaxID=1476464 RepID=A0A285ZS62_9SPHI|nr:heparan-alpha-glucosaminide N-acetyltransferase domain-containing protein [Pedobacter xixiisoli]SOD12493.1 Predicted acyltransferase [Pedobacter xixiisoli]
MAEQTLNPMQNRYLSLDVLRGLTVALMIVVNTPGDWSNIYAPLKHSDWHGFTSTDWVFPTFLFVVGNALSFSINKMGQMSASRFLSKVFKRTSIIFLIGLFLNGFPFFHYEEDKIVFNNLLDIRLWGVLQRIAVCYCLASLMVYFFKKTTVVVSSIAILFGYWAILYFFGDQPDPYSLEGNAIGKVDLAYLPAKNIYKHYPIPFDPLGLLSTLPAIVNVIAGYFTGLFIQKNGNNLSSVWRLTIAGVAIVFISMLWDVYFPINKPLWTSSYVLCSLGYDLIIIALLMLLIEIWQMKNWVYFFEVFGKNPLFIYVLAWLVISAMAVIRIDGKPLKGIVYKAGFADWLTPINASLWFAVVYMLAMWVVGIILDKKKVYVKV